MLRRWRKGVKPRYAGGLQELRGGKQSLLLESSEGTDPDATLTFFNLLRLMSVALYCSKALSL